MGLILIPAQTLVQQNPPVWFSGRVYAQMGVLLIIATTLPLFISATIADIVGSGTLLSLMGLIMLSGFYLAKRKGDDVISNGFGF